MLEREEPDADFGEADAWLDWDVDMMAAFRDDPVA